jgi:hypothetical protein
VQLDEADLNDRSRERVHNVLNQQFLSEATIKCNKYVDPKAQVNLAKFIRENLREVMRNFSWDGEPTYDQMKYLFEIIFKYFIKKGSAGAFSGSQLAFRVQQYRLSRSLRSLVDEIVNEDQKIESVDEAISMVFDFQRHWLQFSLPKYVRVVDRIQKEIFQEKNLPNGDYRYFAGRVEGLFEEPELAALDEYGLPLPIARKIKKNLTLGQGVDSALASLAEMEINSLTLSDFEKQFIIQVKSDL